MTIKLTGKMMAGLFTLGIMAGGLFIWLGVFNIAATDKHWGITLKLLEQVRDRSIHARSDEIGVPPLDDPKMIASGAKNYAAMCAQCHLSPEQQPTELNQGLYPQPPVFHQADHPSHGPAATFWTIKNGLKMTGMPAWGAFHTDQQIWELVAFLSELKEMDSQRYQQLVGKGGHSHAPGMADEHGSTMPGHTDEKANTDHGGVEAGRAAQPETHGADGHHDDHG